MADDTAGSQAQTAPVGSVFSLGWMMAQLFGPLQRRRGSEITAHLPTVSELDADQRMELAFLELKGLLSPYPGLSSADIQTAWKSPGHDGFTAAVRALHLKLLAQLVNDPPQLNAYQLGRALSDTCWLPNEQVGPEFFLREFSRHRLATLQTWLAQAAGTLPALSAATVSKSLQSWQDWADINAAEIQTGWGTVHQPVVAALRTQARAWHAILAGQADSTSPASLDAWAHAGQSILRTTRILMVATLRRFWPIAAALAAITTGLLVLAIANSSGTARVWTSLVTVAAALGVTGGSVRAAAKRAASGIEQDIWRTASLEARAWSATWLPTLPQGRLRQYRLASRGVAVPQARNGLEMPAAAAEPPSAEPVLAEPVPSQHANPEPAQTV